MTQARQLLRIPCLLTFLPDVWFTDEPWFTVVCKIPLLARRTGILYSRFTGDGIAQKKNAYYWALIRDAVKPVRFQKHPTTTKVHVWTAISVRVIIGPYFFHADGKNISVNQYTYQTYVKWFASELKKRRRFKRAVFMLVYKIPYRRAPRLAYRLAFRPSASREQRYLAYNVYARWDVTTYGVIDEGISATNIPWSCYWKILR